MDRPDLGRGIQCPRPARWRRDPTVRHEMRPRSPDLGPGACGGRSWPRAETSARRTMDVPSSRNVPRSPCSNMSPCAVTLAAWERRCASRGVPAGSQGPGEEVAAGGRSNSQDERPEPSADCEEPRATWQPATSRSVRHTCSTLRLPGAGVSRSSPGQAPQMGLFQHPPGGCLERVICGFARILRRCEVLEAPLTPQDFVRLASDHFAPASSHGIFRHAPRSEGASRRRRNPGLRSPV